MPRTNTNTVPEGDGGLLDLAMKIQGMFGGGSDEQDAALPPDDADAIEATAVEDAPPPSGPPPAAFQVTAEPSSTASPVGPGFDLHVSPADVKAKVAQLFEDVEQLEGEVKGWPVAGDLGSWEAWRARAFRFFKLLQRSHFRKATVEDWSTLEAMRGRLARFRVELTSIRSAMVGGESQGEKRGIPAILWVPIGLGAAFAAYHGFGAIVRGWGE
jgi:hypothetical protein